MEQLQEFIQKGQETPSYFIDNFSVNENRDLLKNIHDKFLQDSEVLKQKNEKLIVKHTDIDQVWEQLKLHLDQVLKQHKKQIANLYQKNIIEAQEQIEESEDYDDENLENLYEDNEENGKKKQLQKLKGKKGKQESSDDEEEDNDEEEDQIELEDEFEDEEQDDQEDDENQEEEDEEEEEMEEEEDEQEGEHNKNNDSFEEMERYLNQADIEDQKWEDKLKNLEKDVDEDDEDIDDSDDLGSQYEFGSDKEEAENFFKTTKGNFPNLKDDYVDSDEENDGNQKKKGKQEDAEDDLDDDEVENDVFEEQRENALAEDDEDLEDETVYNEGEIERYESQLMKKNDWQQQGEITSTNRPVNSLVNEQIDFKNNKKEVENITQEYSNKLEDIIKQRILDEAFDDRQRVVMDNIIKENFTQFSRDKSEKGLADLYEDEFKSQLGLTTLTKDDKLKTEIMNLFKETCYKLDALCNLNFTPKPISKQAEIQASKLKLNIDEKIPIQMASQQSQINATELVNKGNATFQSKDEKSHEDNNADRLRKKKALRTRKKELEKKKMLKQLAYTGQTKHEYNLLQQAKQEGKKALKNKTQSSVKFSKSGDFFKNLQTTLDNKEGKQQKKEILDNATKKIKKGQNPGKL